MITVLVVMLISAHSFLADHHTISHNTLSLVLRSSLRSFYCCCCSTFSSSSVHINNVVNLLLAQSQIRIRLCLDKRNAPTISHVTRACVWQLLLAVLLFHLGGCLVIAQKTERSCLIIDDRSTIGTGFSFFCSVGCLRNWVNSGLCRGSVAASYKPVHTTA